MSRKTAIFDEITSLTPFMAGMSYDRLGDHGLVWPCARPNHQGTEILFTRSFPSGRGKLIPVQYAPAKEMPDDDYPFVLNTGRNIYHWHTGAITRRAQAIRGRRARPLCGNGARRPETLEAQERCGRPRGIKTRGNYPPRPGFFARAARPGLHPLPLRGGRREPAHRRRPRSLTEKSPSSSSAP